MMKKAFTMTEVLIVLAILGIVAALVIPALFARVIEKSHVTGCKKAFAELSQATDAAILDHGPLKDWPSSDNNSRTVFDNYFKPHLNITSVCYSQAGCFTKKVTGLNGTKTVASFTSQGYGSPAISFKTASGMNIAFDVQPTANSWYGVSKDYSKNPSMYTFHVDVNGDSGPNVVGRDVFNFVVTQGGLVPAGLKESKDRGCTKQSDGMYCASRVLDEGAMHYLRGK